MIYYLVILKILLDCLIIKIKKFNLLVPQLDIYIICNMVYSLLFLMLLIYTLNVSSMLIKINIILRTSMYKMYIDKKYISVLINEIKCKKKLYYIIFVSIRSKCALQAYNNSLFKEDKLDNVILTLNNLIVKSYIGALTDEYYAFRARNWELSIINSVDILDSLGSNIKVYVYGAEIKRVLPLKNDIINEDWISNKTRYFYDSLLKWRINIPLMKKGDILIYISWGQAFFYFVLKLWFHSIYHKSNNILLFTSKFLDSDVIVTTKFLMKKFGIMIYNKDNRIYLNDFYWFYLNPNFYKIIKNMKCFVFLGLNLRLEAPILNIKLRKNLILNSVLYQNIGSIFNDNLNAISLGLHTGSLINFIQGKLEFCSLGLKYLKKNLSLNFSNINISHIMYLVGLNIYSRIDNNRLLSLIIKSNQVYTLFDLIIKNVVKPYFSVFFKNFLSKLLQFSFFKKKIDQNITFLRINLTNILFEELNLFNSINKIEVTECKDIIYLLGLDTLHLDTNKFIIFQGHHFNINKSNVDLILPSVTIFEKASDYLNIEGDILQTNIITYPPSLCRNHWSILNAIYLYTLNFINSIYLFLINKNITYLTTSRIYTPISTFNKIINFIKKISMNLYWKDITKYKLYNYTNFELIINNIKVYKLYNTFFLIKYINLYTVDRFDDNIVNLFSKYGNVFNNFVKNYMNIC